MILKDGNFYFLKDAYFQRFNNHGLMMNKENGHNRPCYYSFKDSNTNLYWFIPISSKVQKYKRLYAKSIAKYKMCDTILFGLVRGYERAFLIQNMCPVTKNYISNLYIDVNTFSPVTVYDSDFCALLEAKARKVLNLAHTKNVKLTMTDILSIENDLLSDLASEAAVGQA